MSNSAYGIVQIPIGDSMAYGYGDNIINDPYYYRSNSVVCASSKESGVMYALGFQPYVQNSGALGTIFKIPGHSLDNSNPPKDLGYSVIKSGLGYSDKLIRTETMFHVYEVTANVPAEYFYVISSVQYNNNGFAQFYIYKISTSGSIETKIVKVLGFGLSPNASLIITGNPYNWGMVTSSDGTKNEFVLVGYFSLLGNNAGTYAYMIQFGWDDINYKINGDPDYTTKTYKLLDPVDINSAFGSGEYLKVNVFCNNEYIHAVLWSDNGKFSYFRKGMRDSVIGVSNKNLIYGMGNNSVNKVVGDNNGNAHVFIYNASHILYYVFRNGITGVWSTPQNIGISDFDITSTDNKMVRGEGGQFGINDTGTIIWLLESGYESVSGKTIITARKMVYNNSSGTWSAPIDLFPATSSGSDKYFGYYDSGYNVAYPRLPLISYGDAFPIFIYFRSPVGNTYSMENNLSRTQMVAISKLVVTLPKTVTNFNASSGDQEVDLVWTNPVGDTLFQNVILMRKDYAPASGMVDITDIYDGSNIYSGVLPYYNDKINVVNEKPYIYRIFSNGPTGTNTSPNLNVVVITPSDQYINSVTSFNVVSRALRLVLNWTIANSNDVDGYLIVRKTGGSVYRPEDDIDSKTRPTRNMQYNVGDSIGDTTVIAILNDKTNLTYSDNNLSVGVFYYYVIYTYDHDVDVNVWNYGNETNTGVRGNNTPYDFPKVSPQAFARDKKTLVVLFDQAMNIDDLNHAGNFSIKDTLLGHSLEVIASQVIDASNPNAVMLTTAEQTTGTQYKVTIGS